eukprot:GHVR01079937.1.p1 GENE.GHVR01079937.1~~GHVR01079937.1.p1  ORF type:complete len:204 (+),score=7.28 GHVR01079937.1:83-694(+)
MRTILEGSAPFMAPPSRYPSTPSPIPEDYTVGDSAYRTELRDHQEHQIMDKWCINMRHRFTVVPPLGNYERLRIRPEMNKKFRKRQERMLAYLKGKQEAAVVESTPANSTVAVIEVESTEVAEIPVYPTSAIIPNRLCEPETPNNPVACDIITSPGIVIEPELQSSEISQSPRKSAPLQILTLQEWCQQLLVAFIPMIEQLPS